MQFDCCGNTQNGAVVPSQRLDPRNQFLRWLFLLLFTSFVSGCEEAKEQPYVASIRFESATDLLHETSGQLADESWYVHRIGTAKIGHRWSRTFREGDAPQSGRRRLVIDQLEIPRFRGVARQSLRMVELTDASGVVQTMAYELNSSSQRVRVACVVHGKELHIERRLLDQSGNSIGKAETTTLPWSPTIGGFQGIEQALLRSPMRPGEERSISTFVPVNDSVQPYRLKAEADTASDGEDGLFRIIATNNTSDAGAETLVYWVDTLGQTQRRESSFLNQSMQRATELAALTPNELVDFDVALAASVPLDTPIAHPESIRAARYRVSWTGDPPPLAKCDYQQVTRDATQQGSAIVAVAIPSVSDRSHSPVLPSPRDVQTNRWLEVNHPTIQSLADSVAVGETDPGKVAEAIRDFVFRWLDKSAADQVLETALRAAEERKGDCTEHAMLTASVCRARNIPARVAIGLIYDEPSQSMVYHMWTEVWLDDFWHPIDATRPHSQFSATRIKLAHNNLSSASDIAIVMPVLQVAGRIQIEVLEAN